MTSIFDRLLASTPVETPPEVLQVEARLARTPLAVKVDVSSWSKRAGGGKFKAPAAHSPVSRSVDLERIARLARRPPEDLTGSRAEALVELMQERLSLGPRRCKCSRRHLDRLKPIQAWALYEAALVGGLIGSIGVGNGKTIIDILMPMVMPDCKVAVILIPPGLKQQLWDEYEALGEHFKVPSIVFDDNARGRYVAGRPVLHVLPYSKLSRPESTEALRKLNPDLIVADELHRLAHMKTSTVTRFMRYIISKPETRFCGWSGTITKKSIKDYAHLCAIALGNGSPLPLEPHVVEEWATAIDPSDWPAPAGALTSLCSAGEDVQQGFHRRLVETRGFVATKGGSIDASISIFERRAPSVPKVVEDALAQLRDGWERPDGEELVEVTEKVRCAKELACGFYYRWRFPKGTPEVLIEQWRAKRKAWHRELRGRLEHPEEHLDSPLLCANAAERAWGGYKGPLPTWRAETWPAWAEIRDKVKYETEAVWLSDYLVEDAAAWAQKHKGVVWYDYSAFGRRIAEVSGLPCHGGGPNAEAEILAEKGDRSIIASLKAHGTGRNGLQYLFNEQLFANVPSSGDLFEQALGRLHRIGQEADEVNSWVYRHVDELRQSLDRAVLQAKYIQGTLGAQQKLLAATCDFELDASALDD